MRPIKSLHNKFLRTLLLVTALGGLSTLGIVVSLSAQASGRQLAAVQRYIEEGISSKGRVLTENHALALRGLALDNAFLDIRRLVDRAVQGDPDVLYGLYVTSDRQTLAYSRQGVRLSTDRPVPADTWVGLGLSEPELLAAQTTLSHPKRLGETLLEVAAPVRDENGELLGTIRYGLSTRRMQEALDQARAESGRQLHRSLLGVGGLVALISLIGLLLSRIQAARITKPVAELTSAAQALARGDRSVHVDIDSGDELELLGASFNRMIRDLDASYRQLEEMNRTLENKVEKRTAQLAQKNRDMRLVLDNIDQGFVTLNVDGMMAMERSRVVDEWFGGYAKPLPIWEYLAKHSPQFAEQFQVGWDQVVEDILPIDVALDQLPERLTCGLKTFSVRCLPFSQDNKLEGILVVIADITERLAHERDEADQHDLMQAFSKVMLDRSGFSLFLRDGTEMVEAICTRRLDGDMVTLKRTIHTLKGDSASMGLAVVARLCHGLEEQLAEHRSIPDKNLAELYTNWRALSEHIATFGGVGSQRAIEVPETEYSTLVNRLSADGDVHPEVLNQVLSWRLEPVSRPFRRLAEQAKALAKRLEKGDVETVIESNGVRLDPDSWSPFFAASIHVIRNAVDHGLESPAERARAGKPGHGTLTFKVKPSQNFLTFEIGDDGRGVDWETLARRAKENGLPHQTAEDLFAALCADGITTRTRATSTSGRGIGMAAFRQRVESMHGRVEVRSVRGLGTTFVIRFPWSAKDAATGRARRASIAAPPRAAAS